MREEKAGTETIVGVLPDNVSFPKLPAMFARLGIYVRVAIPPAEAPETISLSIFAPWEKEAIATVKIPESEIKEAFENASRNRLPIVGFVIRTGLSPFRVQSPGQIEVIVALDDDEYLAGFLNIQNPKDD